MEARSSQTVLSELPRCRLVDWWRTTSPDHYGIRRRRRGVESLVLACAFVVPIFLAASNTFAEDPSPAVAIPSSDLILEGFLKFATGSTVNFTTREGALILVDHTPAEPTGKVGIALTLDRKDAPSADLANRLIIHTFQIEPDTKGGETVTRVALVEGQPYGEPAPIKVGPTSFQLTATGDHFETFSDGLLISQIWSAAQRGQGNLGPVLTSLYAIYGPTASSCVICDGILICATTVKCGGGGALPFYLDHGSFSSPEVPSVPLVASRGERPQDHRKGSVRAGDWLTQRVQ